MAKDTWSILKKHYPEAQYAVMAEVSDMAGFSRSRSADYIVMGLWPSRGLHLQGIELKSHRSDWLLELKNPKKAENIFQYCDMFSLLTSDETVAKLEEIPSNWGWMNIEKGKIRIIKPAPLLTPVPLSRSFLAAILKRAQDKSKFVHVDAIEDRVRAAFASGKDDNKRNTDKISKHNTELITLIRDFKEASGIDLEHYPRWQTSPKKIGDAVKFIEQGGADTIKKELLQLEKTAFEIVEKITKTLKSL
jgi:hypothetical protein